jgi:hypothetical protein
MILSAQVCTVLVHKHINIHMQVSVVHNTRLSSTEGKEDPTPSSISGVLILEKSVVIESYPGNQQRDIKSYHR